MSKLDYFEEYQKYQDDELPIAWNYLETCHLTQDVENKMDAIMDECSRRNILAWDEKGNITARC